MLLDGLHYLRLGNAQTMAHNTIRTRFARDHRYGCSGHQRELRVAYGNQLKTIWRAVLSWDIETQFQPLYASHAGLPCQLFLFRRQL